MRILSISSLTHENLVMSKSLTVDVALERLNLSGKNFVYLIDEKDSLCGSVTDGDIRRAFLNGATLKTPVLSIACTDPIKLLESNTNTTAKTLCNKHSIKSLPIVDETNRLIGCYLNIPQKLLELKNSGIFIMAGGIGKRLLPLTSSTPKPLLDVGGKPILEYIIDKAIQEGFPEIYISVNYLADQISDFVDDFVCTDVKINLVYEDEPLGTAGSLSLANVSHLENLLVINGDIITDLSFKDILSEHIKSKRAATMAVKRYSMQNPFGVVKTIGDKLISFEEKPIYESLVNMGVYVISTSVISELQHSKYCDMPSFFKHLLSKHYDTGVYEFDHFWMDLGSKKDLMEARELIEDKK